MALKKIALKYLFLDANLLEKKITASGYSLYFFLNATKIR